MRKGRSSRLFLDRSSQANLAHFVLYVVVNKKFFGNGGTLLAVSFSLLHLAPEGTGVRTLSLFPNTMKERE